jgi:hypothetical protein
MPVCVRVVSEFVAGSLLRSVYVNCTALSASPCDRRDPHAKEDTIRFIPALRSSGCTGMHNERNSACSECLFDVVYICTHALSVDPPRLISYPHYVIKVNEVNLQPTRVVIKRA